MPVNRQDTVDTSELLRELRIDRDGRPPRARWRRLVVAVVALVALGAGAWLAWSRISTPAVRTVAARAATPAGGGGGPPPHPGRRRAARPPAPPPGPNNRQGTHGPVREGKARSQGA